MWILINLNELPFFFLLDIVRKYSAGSIILFCEIQEGVLSVSVQVFNYSRSVVLSTSTFQFGEFTERLDKFAHYRFIRFECDL